MTPSVPNTLRQMNATLVLNIIRQHGALSRAQISRISGITKATVSEIINDLLAEKIIYESGVSPQAGQGRKGILINFDPNFRLGIGIDLGGTKIAWSLFNLDADILFEHREATFQTTDRNVFLDRLADSIASFIENSGADRSKIMVIGVATPGIIDIHNGIVLEGSPNLPGWEDLPLAEELTRRTGLPVVLENDIRAALVGEMWCGKCRHAQSAALIGIGTGLGSALLMDGKIIRGANNAAGEIGYMLFNREHLYQNWRNKGCFESYCSGSGLSERMMALTQRQMSAEAIFTAAANHDSLAMSLIEEMADYLTIGIINLVAVANLQKVVLTGGITHAASTFLPRVQANLDRQLFTNTRVTVELSTLREKGSLYGIALLALTTMYPSIQFMSDIQIK
ncbi:ROK family transcriptional regulator [Entomohabitans teleogrylli]|uniref:ROK family transcriptional regulator n=1 Tax=Entomohabitans teleogrylli TaxID=1384589 RepID=UPI000AFC6D76|nr:ROK family transcriptional regulator [Entomohabitans teleogrylli]